MAEDKGNKKLTPEEKDFIHSHALKKGWSDSKIAAALNRAPVTIKKERSRSGLKKKKGGGLLQNVDESVPVESNDSPILPKGSINKSSLNDTQKVNEWRRFFMTTQRYKKLQKQLIADDLETFVDLWANYCLQFDDLKPTEEDQLELLISFTLRIDDNRKYYKDAQMSEALLRQQLSGGGFDKEMDLENEADRQIWDMMQSNNRIQQELNKQFIELTAKKETYFRSLNATREQRESKEKVGSDTFFSLVKMLTEEDQRQAIGKYNELMRMSIDKKREELKQPHQFVNGSVEPILMEGKDYIKKKETKSE